MVRLRRNSKQKIVTKQKKVSKVKYANVKPENIKNALIVKCRESTFQQELKEAKDINYKLFWTLGSVRKIGNALQATKIVFVTGQGIRGFFRITGFGNEKYRGQVQPVVYFDRQFYSFT
jgi:hypothetical protein